MAVFKSLVLLAMFRGIVSQDAIQSCTLSFDGRIPNTAEPALFLSSTSPFNPKNVLGQNVTWDQIIEFPNVPPSRFDNNDTKPVGLSLSDESIFASPSEGQEVALRRAELLVNAKNATVSGHKTWHISLRTDPTRPLNYTHEYALAFHEAQDFQADFWSVKAGARLGDDPPTSQKMLRVEGYKFDVPVKTFFETPLTDDVWHNFGINLNFPNNMISVFYSIDNNPLQLVVPPTFNNISGAGQTTLGETHFGLQKRPVGANLQDFLFNGTQPSGINEAIFLGGIFQDDSCDGCVTL